MFVCLFVFISAHTNQVACNTSEAVQKQLVAMDTDANEAVKTSLEDLEAGAAVGTGGGGGTAAGGTATGASMSGGGGGDADSSSADAVRQVSKSMYRIYFCTRNSCV